MICYKDKTFCSGGTPLCVKFGTCPRALTEQVKAGAKEAGLPISKYLAPAAMPCYSTTAEPAPEPAPDPVARKPARSRSKFSVPRPHVSNFPDSQWHAWFKEGKRAGELAAITKISAPTVRKKRAALGYPSVPSGGASLQRYFESDAKKIAAARRSGDSLKMAAKRAGYAYDSAKTIAQRFRDILPAARQCRARR